MKLYYFLLAAATYLQLTGCALDDSSLLYASRRVVGLSAEFQTAGAGEPSLTLGYRSLDLAKVPVAVAQPKKDGSLELIWGAYCGVNGSGPGACSDIFKAEKVLVGSVTSIAAKTGRTVEEVKKALDSATRGKARFGPTLMVVPLKSHGAVTDLTPEKLTTDLAASLKGSGDEAATKKQLADEITESDAADIVRKDAYSVFGSFTATGGKSALSIGDIFATGVAAQSISEAMPSMQKSLAVSNCVAAASTIANITPAQVIQLCGSHGSAEVSSGKQSQGSAGSESSGKTTEGVAVPAKSDPAS